ncbi:sulfur carrier protein ThiS [Saliterribacillus persicus]|uniref:sulfur carrier protein ThiS n=1 Tax=Saliterribacillus persicus TaxID=930114 RepID=UPI000DF1C471|nr:sulfur carrier protein ThiS [Saliterribacillus persicus]
MELKINGDVITVEDNNKTVEHVIAHLGLEAKSLIVEHNQHILKKEEHPETLVTDGDRLEIVHFVGGG